MATDRNLWVEFTVSNDNGQFTTWTNPDTGETRDNVPNGGQIGVILPGGRVISQWDAAHPGQLNPEYQNAVTVYQAATGGTWNQIKEGVIGSALFAGAVLGAQALLQAATGATATTVTAATGGALDASTAAQLAISAGGEMGLDAGAIAAAQAEIAAAAGAATAAQLAISAGGEMGLDAGAIAAAQAETSAAAAATAAAAAKVAGSVATKALTAKEIADAIKLAAGTVTAAAAAARSIKNPSPSVPTVPIDPATGRPYVAPPVGGPLASMALPGLLLLGVAAFAMKGK